MVKRNLLLLFLLLYAGMGISQNVQLIERLKTKAKEVRGISKVNILNDLVDEILQPKPSSDNCTAAKSYADEAAELAEKLNYDLGMARSFEQNALIYKTLDKPVQYLKWKRKAENVTIGPAMKKQQEELNDQRVELAKLGILIEHQSLKLQEQDSVLLNKDALLFSTEEKVEQLSTEKKLVLLENTLLQKESRIKEIEVGKQALKSRFLIAIMSVFLVLSVILYFLYRSRNRIAGELVIKNTAIKKEQKRSDELLLNILPHEIANELKRTGKAEPKNHQSVSIMFTDFKDFTLIAEKLSPKELVSEIDYCFSAFDEIIAHYGIEKIKTIGDAYLCAYGINNAEQKDHRVIIKAAQEILTFMDKYQKEKEAIGKQGFSIRIGIHTGPIVAGVVGKHKFAYDIWGDAVNTAARMEQSSEAGKINISADTYLLVKDDFTCEYRGKVMAKNKGKVDMYFVEGGE
ncbi:MAG: adenylate/guanylate cyclase domain-containing protein [Bacteroidota bacterium]